jgi:hypothetical protein
MKKNLLVALLAVATIGLTGCNEVKIFDKQAKDYRVGEQVVLSENIIKVGKAAIVENLKDPESARWSTTHLPKAAKPIKDREKGAAFAQGDHVLIQYCIAVNAKNSFGGYTGEQWTLVIHDLTINEATPSKRGHSEFFCNE